MGLWAAYGLQQAVRLRLAGGKHALSQAILLGVQDGLLRRFGGQNERVLDACAVPGSGTR